MFVLYIFIFNIYTIICWIISIKLDRFLVSIQTEFVVLRPIGGVFFRSLNFKNYRIFIFKKANIILDIDLQYQPIPLYKKKNKKGENVLNGLLIIIYEFVLIFTENSMIRIK